MDIEGEREKALTPNEQRELDSKFVEAVKRGIASAERADFVEHGEVLARVRCILNSWNTKFYTKRG